MHEDDDLEEEQLSHAEAVKEAQEKFRRERVRKTFLEKALGFEDKFRKACARVQWIKTKREIVFDPSDPEYKLYLEAKRYLSRFEYRRKLRAKAIQEADKALYSGDVDSFKKLNKVVDKETMECLFCAHQIGGVYNRFVDAIGARGTNV